MQVNPCCTETVSDIGRSDNVAMGSIDYRGKEIYGETSRGKCEEEAMVFTGKLVAKRQEPDHCQVWAQGQEPSSSAGRAWRAAACAPRSLLP